MTQEDKIRMDNRVAELHGGERAVLIVSLEGDEFKVGIYGSPGACAVMFDNFADWCEMQFKKAEGVMNEV